MRDFGGTDIVDFPTDGSDFFKWRAALAAGVPAARNDLARIILVR